MIQYMAANMELTCMYTCTHRVAPAGAAAAAAPATAAAAAAAHAAAPTDAVAAVAAPAAAAAAGAARCPEGNHLLLESNTSIHGGPSRRQCHARKRNATMQGRRHNSHLRLEEALRDHRRRRHGDGRCLGMLHCKMHDHENSCMSAI